ncbi:MAG: hypothetical protein AMXMBFR33_51640 [Candidatus Xenobia bacterium]
MLAEKTLDLLRLLVRVFAQVQTTWALIGGAALPLRGRVRGTRDLDLLVLSQDPDRIVRSLREAGFAHATSGELGLAERWTEVSQAADELRKMV